MSETIGAEIWVDGINTGKVTPAIISGFKEGNHIYAFKKEGHAIYNGTFFIKDNTIQRSESVNSLNDEFHLHICDDCHNISFVSDELMNCHNIRIGEHSMNKTCEYCHTNSTQFTPHIGRGICLNCHGE